MPERLLSSFLFLISIISCSLSAGAAPAISPQNETRLVRLDSILANHFKLVNEKEIRIEGLQQTLRRATTDRDRLPVTRQLYDEFLVYDSDSALLYASESRRIAEKIEPENYNLITEWQLNEAFIYTVQGLYDKTLALLREIDSSRLTPDTKAKYFNTYAYLYSMRAVFLNRNQDLWDEEIEKSNAYRDSLRSLSPQLVGTEWLWVPVALALDSPEKDISGLNVTALQNAVDNNSDPSRLNAINAYWLARYFEQKKDWDKMVKYKTIAATYDAKIVNREIAALQELATYLFDQDDINRAYVYLLYAVNQANLYHNRYRMVSLSDVLPSVRDKYREEIESRDRRLSSLVITLAILSLVLLGAVVFIVVELRKVKKIRNLLDKSNRDLMESVKERDCAITALGERNEELHALNQALNEANTHKTGLLAYAFRLTAHYINTLEEYRKKLLKKYRAKNYSDLGILINDPDFIKEHYQEFYQIFDKMVLQLFPDFIREYNLSASVENQADAETIAKTKTLNTRLRIYALRRLGVSKSSDIASMLNVSIRTVYNNKNNGNATETEVQPDI